jgi:multidrug efflux system membrane fusion protein
MRATSPFLLLVALCATARADEPPKVDLMKGVPFAGRAQATVAQLHPRVAGAITSVRVKEGEVVKKGDVLVELDDRPYKLKLDQARAKLAEVKAKEKVATTAFERVRAAVEKGVGDKGALMEAAAEREAAVARVDAAKAGCAIAELELTYTKVIAPIDGLVGRFTATPGDLLLGDGPALVTVIAADPIAVVFDVDERTYLALARALDKGSKPVVEVGIDSVEGYAHKATLEKTVPTIDPATGTARLRATFANPKGEIVNGQFLRVRLSVLPGK